MDTASTCDFYEATYYILSGCDLIDIKCLKSAGRFECHFLFQSPELPKFQREYLNATAVVNLYAFRRTYGQIQSYAYQAKRKASKTGSEASHD